MPKTHNKNEFCNGFTGNYNGVYWYVMDSIGGVLNHIGENAQNTLHTFFLMILMETITVYIGMWWILLVGC